MLDSKRSNYERLVRSGKRLESERSSYPTPLFGGVTKILGILPISLASKLTDAFHGVTLISREQTHGSKTIRSVQVS
jgi:hypothetical protein